MDPSQVSYWDKIREFSPLIASFALMIGALTSVVTLILYTSKQRQDQWVKNFGDIFEKFWKDPDVAEIRRCVTNDVEYVKISHVLEKRNGSVRNVLTIEENDVIEKIDKFCLVIVRITQFGQLRQFSEQDKHWTRQFNQHWIKKIGDRSELAYYVGKHWRGIRL